MILATVNGRSLDAAAALRRSIVHNEDFLRKSLELLLVREYADRKGIRNTDRELQLATDELRYQRDLESAEKTQQWLKANHQTLESIEHAVDGMLLRNKVRNSIPASEIEAYFAEHRLELDAVDLYSCRLDTEVQARELLAQINDEGANFHVVTMEHSKDEDTRHLGGYAGRLTRGQMIPEIEATVFAAQPGKVFGPVKTEKGYNLFKVAAIHKATLETQRDNIQMILFENHLAKLRAEASISYPILEGAVSQSA
jgi:parvulin-like peptidyl-prolyl isomerase